MAQNRMFNTATPNSDSTPASQERQPSPASQEYEAKARQWFNASMRAYHAGDMDGAKYARQIARNYAKLADAR